MSETAYYLLDEAGESVVASDMEQWRVWLDANDGRQCLGTMTHAVDRKEAIAIDTCFLIATPVFCSCAELFGKQTCCDCRWSTQVYSYAGIIAQLAERLPPERKRETFVSDCFLMRRYKTRCDAIKGHDMMCCFAETCLPRLKMPGSIAGEEETRDE